MMKSYLLGIDIGTSACKVAVFDRNGKVLAAASGDYPVYYPHEGWAEQNPEEWWDAVCRATKETIQKADITADEIAGIGIEVRAGLQSQLTERETCWPIHQSGWIREHSLFVTD